jgi:hypothetical protein
MWLTGGGLDGFTLGLLEHRLLLPVFDHLGLCFDDVQFFFNLGEEGATRAGLLFVAQRQVETDAGKFAGEALALLARGFVTGRFSCLG